MLSRTRRLRSGALALTIAALIPLAIGGSASASTISGPGNFGGGPAGIQLVNQVRSDVVTDHKTVFNVKFGLGVGDGPVVTAVNRATALTSRCAHCNAIAIGFQVVTTTQQDLRALHVINVATATNNNCHLTCNAVADAYQVVVATDTPRALTYGQLLSPQQLIALIYLRGQFLALTHSSLSLGQIQDQCLDLVGQAMAILQDANYAGPDFGTPDFGTPVHTAFARPTASPALQGPSAAAAPASSNQPVVKLYRDVQFQPAAGG
jgi:hypothetical protein